MSGEIKSLTCSCVIIEFWCSFIGRFEKLDFWRLSTSWSNGIDLRATSRILYSLETYRGPYWSLSLHHLLSNITLPLELALILKVLEQTWHSKLSSFKEDLTHCWHIVSPQNSFKGSLRLDLTLFWFSSWKVMKHTGHFWLPLIKLILWFYITFNNWFWLSMPLTELSYSVFLVKLDDW